MHISSRPLRRLRVAAACLIAVVIAMPVMVGGASASAATPSLPCDIYAAGGTPCEAAYSTTRALIATYDGSLYQVQRASDGGYLNIGVQAAGGVADSALQNAFCAGTTCTITQIYDQTANGNTLTISAGNSCAGCSNGFAGPGPGGSDIGAPAAALPITVGGRSAYGVLIDSLGTGYRIDDARNVPTGNQPEGIYMLTSSNVTSGNCCFDFGSAEANNTDDGNNTMNAIYYGTECWTRNCTGSGPWVGGDLENGMYFSNTGANPASIPTEKGSFVTAWEKNNGTNAFTLKYGNGQQGGLTQSYSGPLPGGYGPMQLQPSIELGTGGDNSLWGAGEFFEGAVTAGYPTDATDNAVQTSVVAAGYANNTVDAYPTASVVSLRAHANGEIVTADNAGSSPLIANRSAIGSWEEFDLIYDTVTVSLRAHANGQVVTADNAGSSPLIANRGAIGPWETFDLISNAGGGVSLRAHANGEIVTADNAGSSPLIANRSAIGPWEQFDLIDNPDGSVSLRAHANGEIVTADNAGSSPLIANRSAIGSWEEFDLVYD